MSIIRMPIWKKERWRYRFLSYCVAPVREHLRYRHLVFNLMHLTAIALLVYWWHHLPPAGYAVGVLAVLAVAMSVHGEMRMGHRVLWMLLVGAFLFTEFRAIGKDRTDFADAQAKLRKEENSNFKEIADHLESAIQLSHQQFDETMRQFGENVNTITGGNSFAIVWAPIIPMGAPNTFPLVLQVRGRYDLQDVRVDVVKLPEPGFGTAGWAQRYLSGNDTNAKTANLGNVGHTLASTVPIVVSASDDGDITEYSINVFARNRMTHESLRIRKNLKTNQWESSIEVIDGRTNKTLEQSKPEWRVFALAPLK